MKKNKATNKKAKSGRARATGSTAIPMTYGDYLKKYPCGLRDDAAKSEAMGYAIIDNSDHTNITWLSDKGFRLINMAFSKLPK